MTRTDDNYRVAQIIKGLEERIADLEEKDRETGTPNVLRTFHDQILVADQPPVTESIPLEPLLWNDAPTAAGESVFGNVADTGWHTGTWGSY